MEYDVCLSFAGEDRPYVEAVAAALRKRGVRVFYDRYEKVQLWGKDLYQHLDDIYRNRARYCLIFASAAYASKLWTRHELSSAQARAIKGNEDYILPARFDDTEIPGILPTTGYLDLRRETPEQVAELIESKLALSPAAHDPRRSASKPTAALGPLRKARHARAQTERKTKRPGVASRSAPVPAILYHYTNGAGLLGVLATRKIWATDSRYLADKGEIARAQQLIGHAVAQLSVVTPRAQQFATAVRDAALATNLYVAAFSESGDMLSQWRRYASRTGFSMGFDASVLHRLRATELVRVQYDAKIQLDLVDAVIKQNESVIADVLDQKNLARYGHVVDDVAMELALVAAACKSPSFADEQEWRLLAVRGNRTARHFRDTATGPTPYVELPLALRAQALLPLRTVTHAPSDTPGLTRNGLIEVLSEYGYAETVAASSAIPGF